MALITTGKQLIRDLEKSGALGLYVPPEGGYEGRYQRRVRAAGYTTLLMTARGLGDLAAYLTGVHENAVASFHRALEIQPDCNRTWYNLGLNLGKIKRYEDAIAAFDRVLELKPDDYWGWYHRGVALEQVGRQEEADISHNKAIAIQAQQQLENG